MRPPSDIRTNSITNTFTSQLWVVWELMRTSPRNSHEKVTTNSELSLPTSRTQRTHSVQGSQTSLLSPWECKRVALFSTFIGSKWSHLHSDWWIGGYHGKWVEGDGCVWCQNISVYENLLLRSHRNCHPLSPNWEFLKFLKMKTFTGGKEQTFIFL
jgi:hypothetical protein